MLVKKAMLFSVMGLLLLGAGCQTKIKQSSENKPETKIVASETEDTFKNDDTKKDTKLTPNDQPVTNDTSPIITENKTPIAGVPKEVNEFLDLEDIDALKSKGFKVYTGATPPSIVGNYNMGATITYDPGTFEGAYPIGYVLSPYVYTLSNQLATKIKVDYVSTEADDRAKGIGAFISGSGNCFTIYINQKGKMGSCSYASPQLMSGCKTDTGITNFTTSYTAKSKSGPDCDQLMPIGYLRIANDPLATSAGAGSGLETEPEDDYITESPEVEEDPLPGQEPNPEY